MKKEQIPFKERSEKNKNGLFWHPEVLMTMLEKAARQPLKNLVDPSSMRHFENYMYICDESAEIETYQDAVNYIQCYRKYIRDNDKASEDDPDVSIISDLLGFLGDIYISEFFRRQNPKDKKCIYNCVRFPVLIMPLPQLFQAGALRCTDIAGSITLEKAYESTFKDILENDSLDLGKTIKNYQSWQPVFNRCLCDATTAMCVIRYASEKEYIDKYQYEDLTYDLIVAPFEMDQGK